MAESINLLYLDEQTLQKGEIKKSFWTKKGIIISQSTLNLKITMCMVFSRLHVVIQVYGKTFTQNHSLQEHKRQFLLKNREHKNTQKWHAQNVMYIVNLSTHKKNGCPIENKNTKSSNLATEDESQPLSDIKEIKQNG